MNDNKLVRSFLYILFFFLIAAAGVIAFYIFTMKPEVIEPEVMKMKKINITSKLKAKQ